MELRPLPTEETERIQPEDGTQPSQTVQQISRIACIQGSEGGINTGLAV